MEKRCCYYLETSELYEILKHNRSNIILYCNQKIDHSHIMVTLKYLIGWQYKKTTCIIQEAVEIKWKIFPDYSSKQNINSVISPTFFFLKKQQKVANLTNFK